MCLGVVLGTRRQKKLTGMVATKQRRNLSTGTDTPMVAAMDGKSRSMAGSPGRRLTEAEKTSWWGTRTMASRWSRPWMIGGFYWLIYEGVRVS